MRRKLRVPGIRTTPYVRHSCGHRAYWLFDGDRGILEAPTRHAMSQYPCPCCGGETGHATYEGKQVLLPPPPATVRMDDFGATVFVECEPEDVLLGI